MHLSGIQGFQIPCPKTWFLKYTQTHRWCLFRNLHVTVVTKGFRGPADFPRTGATTERIYCNINLAITQLHISSFLVHGAIQKLPESRWAWRAVERYC
jgi:hypothetical protein